MSNSNDQSNILRELMFDVNHLDETNWKQCLSELRNLQGMAFYDSSIGFIISSLRSLIGSYASFATEQLESINDSYRLMCDYLLKGYPDDHRESLYSQLLQRLYGLICDTILALNIKYDSSLASLVSSSARQPINVSEVRTTLENFVSDCAMLEFEPEALRAERLKQYYQKRHQFLCNTFIQILLSGQWNHDLASDMAQLLSSPTIDSVDAQTLTSAIMLNTFIVTDAEKVLALMYIFRHTSDEYVRQRAFVGWVFAVVAADYRLYPAVKQAVDKMLDDDDVCNDIMELQMQVIYCRNAEQDNETIRRDVMPILLKNQSFEISRFGIKEKDDDELEDILHPDEDDKRMEQIEDSMKRVSDMQREGADIYFGGFSHMKRFGFFSTLANWFMPFYSEHPQLQPYFEKITNFDLLKKLSDVGQFCDSDKYSFAISTASVIDKLPDSIREPLLSESSFTSFGGNGGLDITAPIYIRRRYLQDLYRFFRLNDHRKAFFDPFVIDLGNVFFCNDIFDAKLHTQAIRVSHFLMHRNMYLETYKVMKKYFDATSFDDLLLMGRLDLKFGNYNEAATYYEKALRMRPDEERAIKGYAMLLFEAGKYEKAAVQYKRLMDMHSEKYAYALNYAISLINANELEKGIQFLYALYYKNEDDIDTKRALAWGLLCQKKLDRAEKLYQEILADAACNEGDYLNTGYCAWFLGHRQKAIQIFKEHVKNLHGKMDNDTRLFDLYGISHAERQMIADIYLS